MKKIFLCVIAAIFMMAVACSKENEMSKNAPSVEGKWTYSSTDNSTPYYIWRYADINPDTLIFKANNYFFIDKKSDTLEAGTYSVGYGKSPDGYGVMQEHDSVLFHMEKNASTIQVALPPTYTLYYEINNNVLSFSNMYKSGVVAQGTTYYSKTN